MSDTERPVVAVDFDGVISTYLKSRTRFEQDVLEDAYDYPVEGALEWIQELVQHCEVVIFTCRALIPQGQQAVEQWLRKWGFPALTVTALKPVAKYYLDDRGQRFDGLHYPPVAQILNFKPWNRL